MRVDVSEIKSYRACKRSWLLSSRNRFHLRPRVTPTVFAFGTIFHEALHMMYMNVPLEKVMDMVTREMNPETDTALLAMVPGYYDNVLPGDLERYQVLDIEHQFSFPVPNVADLNVCGSIDMVCLDKNTNQIFGFEHKTAKNYRDDHFLWMDEQPRVYTVALQKYVEEYNEKQMDKYYEAWDKWDTTCQEPDQEPVKPTPVTLGGIYINEVKKLLRRFDYKRSLCVYAADDLENFMGGFYQTCMQCHESVTTNDVAVPQPNYMGCKMCNFQTICETYKYSTLVKDVVLDEFSEEFVERDSDHLDEKVERNVAE